MNNSTSIMHSLDTNGTAQPSLDEQSLIQLDLLFVLNILLYEVLAPMTILSNFGCFVIFTKGRNVFQSHHYRLLRHLTAVATVNAIAHMIVGGIIRTVRKLYRIPDTGVVFMCAFRMVVQEITTVVDRLNMLIIATDRLFAMMFPIYYKEINLSKKYTVGTLAFPWLAGIVEIIIKHGLYTEEFAMKVIPFCVLANTRTAFYLTLAFAEGIFVDSLIVVVYMMALIFVIYKLHSATGNVQQLKKNMGLRLMVVCAVDGVIYTLTYFASSIWGNVIVINASAEARNYLGPIVYLFILSSSVPRFFVYYKINKEFKLQVKKIFCCKSNVVVDLTTGASEMKTESTRGNATQYLD